MKKDEMTKPEHAIQPPFSLRSILVPDYAEMTEANTQEHDLQRLQNRGARRTDLDFMQSVSGLTTEQLSRMLDTRIEILTEKSPFNVYDEDVSHAILELAAAYGFAYSVFGNWENVRKWMRTGNANFNGWSPIERMHYGDGFKDVRNVLENLPRE